MLRRWLIVALVVLGGAIPALAAIAVSEPVAEVASTANTTSYAFGAFTSVTGSHLVVLVYAPNTIAADTTMAGGGLTWTMHAQETRGGNTSYIYSAPVVTGASTTITFDCTSDAASGALMAAFQFTGQDTGSPVRQTIDGQGTSTNPTVTFASSLLTTSGYAMAFGRAAGQTASTEPSSWTETVDVGISTPSTAMGAAYRAGGETGTAYTYTADTAVWCAMGIEIAAASAGANCITCAANHYARQRR